MVGSGDIINVWTTPNINKNMKKNSTQNVPKNFNNIYTQ